jgi:hypothetical protein
MLNTSKFDGKEEVKNYVSKYLNDVGIHKLKINKVEAQIASTKSAKFIFHVESPTVESEDFTAAPEATNGGVVGKIKTNSFLKTPEQWEKFAKDFLSVLGRRLNVKEVMDMKVNSVKSTDPEEYAKEIAEKLTETFENTGYIWMRVVGEKYMGKDKEGNPVEKTTLLFPYLGRVFATLEEGKEHLKPVDKTNSYDLKPIPVENTNAAVTGAADY